MVFKKDTNLVRKGYLNTIYYLITLVAIATTTKVIIIIKEVIKFYILA